MTTCTDRWENCYETGWKGWVVPEAFSHPAKFSRCLIERIYDHAMEMGWIKAGEVVLDPFGGVCLGGLTAMSYGLSFIAVELEEKFVKLGEQNIILWNSLLADLPNLGTATIIQGDSRRLKDVIEKADLVVSSPPYSTDQMGGGGNKHDRNIDGMKAGYGHTLGNLANLKEGKFEMVVSSPPYAEGEKGHPSLGSVNNDDWGKDGRDITRRRGKTGEYGKSPGQLGSMKEGSFDLCMSSPPYAEARIGQESGQEQCGHHDAYSKEKGQLGAMKEGPFDLCVSSPPYEGTPIQQTHMTSNQRGDPKNPNYRPSWKKKLSEGYACTKRPYGEAIGQLGETSSDTFWSASREIVQQCFDLLKPNGHTIWVCKDYVKNKRRVPFSDKWLALCESVGFKLVCRHQAMLIKEESGSIKEKKSFFRRLAETNIRAANHWNIVSRTDQAKYLWKAKKEGWKHYRKMIDDNNPDHPPIFPTKSKVINAAKHYALHDYLGDVRDWDDERIINHEDILCLIKP